MNQLHFFPVRWVREQRGTTDVHTGSFLQGYAGIQRQAHRERPHYALKQLSPIRFLQK